LIFSKKIFLFIFCFFLISFANAQDLTEPIQSPRKAAILSSTLPGLGQIYNKKYWKIPIIYAGLLTSAYYINDNNVQYKLYKDAYLKRLDNNPDNDDFVGEYSSGDLLILKDFYRRNREVSILCFVGTYIINVLDASVDAHLFDYDISEDISLQITPTSTTNFNGLSLTLNL
tara:strand:+ start:2023 stop:2538 length:516 start_codon:yes stop_codon:yes gene_type:complete